MDIPKDKIQDFTVICEGGLDSKNTFIELSRNTPGAATQLINFEPGLYGGYRRINGFEYLDANYPEVDSAAAEGKVLGLIIFMDEIYAMRKQQSGTTYKVYRYDSGSGWVAQTLGFTLNTTAASKTVDKIRYEVFNFGDGDMLCFVDGVNPATLFDGTNWTQIISSNTGADFANAGGNQALDAPAWVESFSQHLFFTDDPDSKSVVAHSAPRDATDWTAASGGGQIITGFNVNGFKPWRDRLYVFGRENIGYVSVDGTDFVFKNVSDTIGLISPDTLVEINGDLLFLSQDGFRPIAGTDKIDDIQLNTLSRKIQKLVTELSSTYPDSQVSACTIRSKNQVRFFFNSETVDTAATRGILGGIRESNGQMSWEWGELLGIQAAVTTSGWINDVEYVIHGDYAGNVFRQERGNSFNGADITAVYTTPYLDINSPMIRKKMRDVHVFIEPEGTVNIQAAVTYDWADPDKLNPAAYTLEGSDVAAAVYGGASAIYGATGIVYGAGVYPVLKEGIQGTFYSAKISFSTTGTEAPYAIQTLIYEFTPQGRR
jgi:hypothetical protein